MELDNDDHLQFKELIHEISSASASLLHCWIFGPPTEEEMKSYKRVWLGLSPAEEIFLSF